MRGKCSGNWLDIIDTGLQTGAQEVQSSNSRFNGLLKKRSRGKPLKRLRRARQAMTTGLKVGVNESEDSVKSLRQISRTLRVRESTPIVLKDKPIHLVAGFGSRPAPISKTDRREFSGSYRSNSQTTRRH